MTAIEPKAFRWRLRVMMAERGITTVTELHRRLEPLGVKISTQQLNRVVSEIPQRLNTDLLAALLTVLKCTPNDLLYVDVPEALSDRSRVANHDTWNHDGATVSSPARKRVAVRKAADPSTALSHEQVLGPKVAPFPFPERKPKA